MANSKSLKMRRFLIWFAINMVVFVACYLNYRLQLKHRYLFKMLNVGLCLSRAAAMVINFNLLLVWLPMCKYSLTRFAYFANVALKKLRLESMHVQTSNQVQLNYHHYQQSHGDLNTNDSSHKISPSIVNKFKASVDGTSRQLRHWLSSTKLNLINGFLMAVDHCTSMHTICATTITIASVIHTVAHLMNVINFSRNYDSLLTNLNMAEFKGQNPFQLLISVPGITGILMIIILLLMSLSSIDYIRNCSFDMFQVFHRLSVIFVLLLFLHPSSHVLKEQSNIDRHDPAICYPHLLNISNKSTKLSTFMPFHTDAPQEGHQTQYIGSNNLQNETRFKRDSNRQPSYNVMRSPPIILGTDPKSKESPDNSNLSTGSDKKRVDYIDPVVGKNKSVRADSELPDRILITNERFRIPSSNQSESTLVKSDANRTNHNPEPSRAGIALCQDAKPLFVAQSSVCWYVLTFGLSCYLLDLILRRSQRSKNSIELLDIRLDRDGNILELVLSNNHRRFAHWLPGQFVYLNCPQIAVFEWHPFTISSMDDRNGHFTLHIKTGGDWTRKLRDKLLPEQSLNENKLSILSDKISFGLEDKHRPELSYFAGTTIPSSGFTSNLKCYGESGNEQVICTKISPVNQPAPLIPTRQPDATIAEQQENHDESDDNDCLRIDIGKNQCRMATHYKRQAVVETNLRLFIDGPFHSPFERLLDQQVSICIASGVGWTAFSSIFHCLTNDFPRYHPSQSAEEQHIDARTMVKLDSKVGGTKLADGNDSPNWTRLHNLDLETNCDILKGSNLFKTSFHEQQSMMGFNLPAASKRRGLDDKTRLHLMVIVTSVEQLKPFYRLALNYFKQIQLMNGKCQIMSSNNEQLYCPVRGITAFLTRSNENDQDIIDFCNQENLCPPKKDQIIWVNDSFSINFGKPRFDLYLNTFNNIYPAVKKISVYCCGSYQVKRDVRMVCSTLNRINTTRSKLDNEALAPRYTYHEENF